MVADDLGLPLVGEQPEPAARTRDRFSWAEHMRLALLMLPFGHSFFEQSYRYDESGRARLRKLAWRPPRTIAKVNVAPDGGLESIEQHARSGTFRAERPIPVSQLVAYVHDREGGNWLGSSLLRPAYKHRLIKDRLGPGAWCSSAVCWALACSAVRSRAGVARLVSSATCPASHRATRASARARVMWVPGHVRALHMVGVSVHVPSRGRR